MKRSHLSLLLLLATWLTAAGAAAGAVADIARSVPEIPEQKMHKGQPEQKVVVKHEAYVKVARANQAKLVFIGDSITEAWRSHTEIWTKAFGAYAPANFGIGWDRTQNVLWRLENGELDGFTPTAAVVLIGTNNIQADAPADVAKGITRIVALIREKSPATKVLLLAIFPRGAKAQNNPEREKIRQVNDLIATLHDGTRVFFMDIGGIFLRPDGTMAEGMGPDHLHLTAKGYQQYAEAIGPRLAELMK